MMINSFRFTTFQIVGLLWMVSNSIVISKGDIRIEFIKEPASMVVNPKDGKASFHCLPAPTSAIIEWLQNGELIAEGHDETYRFLQQKLIVRLPKRSNESGAPSLNSPLATPRDFYLQCLARIKGQAIISRPAKLIIGTLSSFTNKNDTHITITQGNTAFVPCKPPYSVPSVVTEFEFNGTQIDNKIGRYLFQPSGNLQILNAQLNDSGTYRCIAHNPFLEERKASKRLVYLKVIDSERPMPAAFSSAPPATTASVMGSNVSLECSAHGFPIPNVTWHKKHGTLPLRRHGQQAGNLLLFSVRKEDEGTYVCRAENGIGRAVTAETKFDVQEIPQIVKHSHSKRTHEGHQVSLDCVTKGEPRPLIMWYHNGIKVENSSRVHIKENKLVIHKTKHSDRGIYQCFASNELEAAYETSHLAIMSKGKKPHNSSFPVGEHHHKNKTKIRRKSKIDLGGGHRPTTPKGVKMVPPTKPEVTRVNDEDTVMVRWKMPDNDGLPVSFFKVQYRELDRGDRGDRGNSGGSWNTTDEDIPTYLGSAYVSGLKKGARYKFRISAVYSNNDNTQSPESDKFSLSKDTPMKRPGQKPVILSAKATSPSAIELEWEYRDAYVIPVTGFIIHYRAVSMAGDYSKVTVSGYNTCSHIITHLLPDTPYDLKMQSFNDAGTSDFSLIYTIKTKVAEVLPDQGKNGKPSHETDTEQKIKYTSGNSSSTSSKNKLLYIILGVALGIMVIVLIIFLVIFSRRKRQKKNRRGNVSNGNQIPHLAVNGHSNESNGYAGRSRPKINISVNPLSEVDTEINGEGIYPLVHMYSEIPSNNNDVISLSTLEREHNRRMENGNANHQEDPQTTHQAIVHETTT